MMTRHEWRNICQGELGKPYIWGANGPDAYDCSGFAQWALRPLNLDPPGDQTAEGLYRHFSAGRARLVSEARADLGDLVFFGSDAAIGHVGLAWGDGVMIEAGGGGRGTTSVAIARSQGAQVRLRPISRRKDLVAILRPAALAWQDNRPFILAADTGRYEGAPPRLEWLGDGRSMRLTSPFAFIQAGGTPWPVPAGSVVDGASIPRVFWSLIGGPFEGRYRDASIVHDHFCVTRDRPWPQTHRVFYDAMICSGVAPLKAKVMYYAVYRFGPRWTLGPSAVADGFPTTAPMSGPNAGRGTGVPADLPVEPFDAVGFEADARLIRDTDPDVAEIEALAQKRQGRAAAMPGPVADDASPLAAIAAEARAAFIRRPLIAQLVALQDESADAADAAAIGALLSRYSALTRDAVAEAEHQTAPMTADPRPPYAQLYASCTVRPERRSEVAWYRNKVLQHRGRYEKVAALTAAPWWFIGIIHALEASFNFNAHLHNGDPLSGRTVRVPAGRPPQWNPPDDWESSAVDAIVHDRLDGLRDWTIATALHRWEAFNGFGYRARGINSPYLWSFSNHYSTGKFVRDREFDPDAVSRQCGAAVILRALEDAGMAVP